MKRLGQELKRRSNKRVAKSFSQVVNTGINNFSFVNVPDKTGKAVVLMAETEDVITLSAVNVSFNINGADVLRDVAGTTIARDNNSFSAYKVVIERNATLNYTINNQSGSTFRLHVIVIYEEVENLRYT